MSGAVFIISGVYLTNYQAEKFKINKGEEVKILAE